MYLNVFKKSGSWNFEEYNKTPKFAQQNINNAEQFLYN